jgi:hypothetical protein
MIISASRRTDIPAFYSDWFYNRIKAGYLLVRNPMNVHQVSKINLNPNVVDCIVFWSKNPRKMLNRLNELKDYSFYFQYTLTGYGRQFEPKVPLLDESISTFTKLSSIIGKEKVIWRYDPIILTKTYDLEYHKVNFSRIAEKISGKTQKCVISFVDIYSKLKNNLQLQGIEPLTGEQIEEISFHLGRLAPVYGLEIVSCAEDADLLKFGIKHGKCIDNKLIEEVFGFSLEIKKDSGQRDACGCIASIDIGAYNTCLHECVYCYATYNHAVTKKNYLVHNPMSPLLFGNIEAQDKITDRKVFSCKRIQHGLF